MTKNKSLDFNLLKNICSSIYLLLVDPSIRSKAHTLNLKDSLIDMMLKTGNSSF